MNTKLFDEVEFADEGQLLCFAGNCIVDTENHVKNYAERKQSVANSEQGRNNNSECCYCADSCGYTAYNYGSKPIEAKECAKILLLLFAVTAVFRNLSFMSVIGILRSGGDTTFCMISETLIVWLISVPLVIFGGISLGLNIYLLYLLSNVSEVIKAVAFIWRIKSRRWVKFVAKEAQ